MAADSPIFERALAAVEGFSEKSVAVLPEQPSVEMLNYVAHVTGEDKDKLRRLYELFLAVGRLDSFSSGALSGSSAGFAEEENKNGE